MLLKGDCIEVMKAMKPNSVDAICTDPPYGLEFMGKDWDRLNLEDIPKGYIECEGNKSIIKKKMPRFHQTAEHQKSMQLWHTRWLTEAFRVLKPGASMLVMGGTRTSHRLACAIEDCGFIIKDTLMWIFGSGFPKAQEASTLVDAKILGVSTKEVKERREKIGVKHPQYKDGIPKGKGFHNCLGRNGAERIIPEMNTKPLTPEGEYWDGFKVGGIKPSYEPIIWAVKPPEGSYIDNVLKWGVGAVNVDECRIGIDKVGSRSSNKDGITRRNLNFAMKEFKGSPTKGRFPANIILSHHPECVQVGMKRVKGAWSNKGIVKNRSIFNANLGQNIPVNKGKYYDIDGYETVESWQCHPDCAVRLLDEQSRYNAPNRDGNKPSISRRPCMFHNGMNSLMIKYGDSGGASRFFKQCNYGQEEWLCHEGCALRQLDEQSGPAGQKVKPGYIRKSAKTKDVYGKYRFQNNEVNYTDNGGASRFFYCAKASRGERNAGLEGMEEKAVEERHAGWTQEKTWIDRKDGKGKVPVNIKMKPATNNHPTVKPIKLFEWLIKLVTREGQIILDPFIGSGTTAIAAHNVGRKCIGIEKEGEYIEIARRRVAHWRSRPRQLEIM